MRQALPTWPRLCEWRRTRQKEFFRTIIPLATGRSCQPWGRLPEDRCPTWGQRADFGQMFATSAQNVLFRGRV